MHPSMPRSLVVLPLLVSLLLASSAGATLVLQKSARQLGDESDAVVQGVVERVQSHWNADHSRIFTAIDLRVDASHKGVPASRVRVVQMGGTLDGVRMTVAGAVQWREGEQVLLFLERGREDFRVAGFSQGKFELERDSVTRRLYAKRELPSDAEYVQRDGTKTSAPAVGRVLVSDLLAEALPSTNGGK